MTVRLTKSSVHFLTSMCALTALSKLENEHNGKKERANVCSMEKKEIHAIQDGTDSWEQGNNLKWKHFQND